MRRQQDRLAEPGEVLDDLPGLAARAGIEARGWLVEEEQVGIARQPDREVEPTALPAGQLADAHAGLFPQVDQAEELVERPRVRVVAAAHVDHLGDGEIRLDTRRLEHDADALLHGALAAGRVEAEHRDVAAVARAIALQDLDGRRLPGAVGTEQREDLALVDGQVDAGDRLQLAVRLAQPADHDGRRTVPRGGGAHGAVARSDRAWICWSRRLTSSRD